MGLPIRMTIRNCVETHLALRGRDVGIVQAMSIIWKWTSLPLRRTGSNTCWSGPASCAGAQRMRGSSRPCERRPDEPLEWTDFAKSLLKFVVKGSNFSMIAPWHAQSPLWHRDTEFTRVCPVFPPKIPAGPKFGYFGVSRNARAAGIGSVDPQTRQDPAQAGPAGLGCSGPYPDPRRAPRDPIRGRPPTLSLADRSIHTSPKSIRHGKDKSPEVETTCRINFSQHPTSLSLSWFWPVQLSTAPCS
jgi:hypothetical protein